ncbi:phage resistance protein [Thermomonospora cellulosilytica]|uniref:Phage resistance protein n=1 Tax=Thermomonospora cellulosilytica TaxID=1411118 RepID=A0A7W3RA72_9ACTN|nr:phage resistance protein [Thermomonospora cellulosilytica]MBA9004995.1 hypothetical protein [Thermomonospora cellulosilytica]
MAVRLLRDLIDIPERVHAGDFVLTLSKGVGEDSTIRDYVVTDQLADCFDQALGIIQSAVEGGQSRAAYLDGSFGSGKSHFMAVLHAVLRQEPAAWEKEKLAEVVREHRSWLKDRRFLLVPYHMIEASSLESAVLGGYVNHVRKIAPDAPLPAVYRDEQLLADARDLRARLGDEAFVATLPAATGEDAEWEESGWGPATLDAALAAPPGDPERRRLVTDLLAGPFHRYAQAVSGTEAFIELDRGLSEISRHAKEVLGYDAIVLMLDELVLWLSSYIGDTRRVQTEAQKVSKLVESAEHERPAPIVSFVPRQRDLRDLVRRDTAGAVTASLFDTLKYWDGRFDVIRLEDRNLPAVVKARLLRAKNAEAEAALDEAFTRTSNARSEVWEVLLDAQGGGSDVTAFRATYPFSPAFLHAMVDISAALQRQRTALKLMQQLLVDYRDVLEVGQLMPLGAIYDVLAIGADRPFTDRLRAEFQQAKEFYTGRLRPFLLARHKLTDEQAAALPPRHAFRADDLVVKTLLLAALVPNVPALRNLTAGRLAALNHGSIVTMLPGQDRAVVARTLRDLAVEFGEFQVSGDDDPAVEVSLIRVDTGEILKKVLHVDDDAAKRRLIRSLLWREFDAHDRGEFVTTRPIVWRGTDRVVELVFGNIRDPDNLADEEFKPLAPGALRVVIDYPFDKEAGPAEDHNRLRRLQERLDRPLTLAWVPSFLSPDRIAELGDLVKINYVLERRDRLEELTATLTAEDREHARAQLRSRQDALTKKLMAALHRAYGLASADDADLGARSDEPIVVLDSRLELRPPAGLGFGEALQRLCSQLLDHTYPRHPDFDPSARRQVIRRSELATVLRTVEQAAQDRVGRLEVPKADIPVLKRIANPAGIATVTEVFVLRDEWKMLIARHAGQSGKPTEEISVADARRWVLEEQPGLPPLVVDLLVACFAIQDNRSWYRAGQPIAPPELDRIEPDMTLRRQELPAEEEFGRAMERARVIFGAARQPVNTARAVQSIAVAVRRRAGDLLPDATALVRELERHRDTLGLDDRAPRLATARTIADLLDRMSAQTDPTRLVKDLAAAPLADDPAIYRAALDATGELVGVLARLKWPILDQLPVLAGQAGDRRERAAALWDALRDAARHNEHSVPLRKRIEEIEQEAIDLIIVPPPPPPPPPETKVRRVSGQDVGPVLDELRADADAHPAATFEITWRIVKR